LKAKERGKKYPSLCTHKVAKHNRYLYKSSWVQFWHLTTFSFATLSFFLLLLSKLHRLNSLMWKTCYTMILILYSFDFNPASKTIFCRRLKSNIQSKLINILSLLIVSSKKTTSFLDSKWDIPKIEKKQPTLYEIKKGMCTDGS